MADKVAIGDHYDQDQIEEIFDTGFGYQITGINVRRDDADQRYILLFAKEDGPYDDDVRKGQFEYIGEGLSGNQSASSPGNSALIDAVETSVPIYFFYKGATDEGWEYQGIVAVQDYRIEEHNERDVFVFEMEHTENQSNAAYPLPGGVTAYVDTLEQMLLYIESNEPTYDELLQWFFTTFNLSGEGYIKRGISLIKKLGFIDRTDGHYQVAESGQIYLKTRDEAVVYQILNDQLIGIEFLLQELLNEPKSADELNEAILNTFDEPQWEKPHQTKFRLNWLRSLGTVAFKDSQYQITRKGRRYIDELVMPGLYLIPVSESWRLYFDRTVDTPIMLETNDVPEQLAGYDSLRIWGTTETDSAKKQAHMDNLETGDWLLFYHSSEFIATGRVGRVFESPSVGEWLWDSPKSSFIFTLEEYEDTAPSIDYVWDILEYDGRQVVNGFERVRDDRVQRVITEYGSLETALFEADRTRIEREKSTLEAALESEPQLTEDTADYTTARQRTRDRAFRELVLEAYDETCAVCGANRHSPDGTPEVEAAHIYPRSENGRDDVRNGIALCRLHHWAFDTGWIEITTDYEISVLEKPGREEYHEFEQLDGQEIRRPDNKIPHPDYLVARRQL